jgi:hypothetical protein
MTELLQASTVAVRGTVEQLGDAVIFVRNPDGSPYMIGTLTTVKVDQLLFGSLNPEAGGRVTFLQSGGTAEGVSVSFAGEPLLQPGDEVIAFGPASEDAPSEGVPGFWTIVFAGVDASGQLEPSVAQEVAPFLAGMSVTDIARAIAELSPVVDPAPPSETFPPTVTTPQ